MSGLWERLFRKARGILGLGVAGAAVGFLGGGLLGFVTTILDVGLFLDAGYWSLLLKSALSSATYFAQPAAFASASFGVLLAVADGRRSLLDLPLWRMALFGALGGGLFIPAYILVRIGPSAFAGFPISIVPTIGLLSGLGGLLAVSLTAIAQRAHRAELRVVHEVEVLAGPE